MSSEKIVHIKRTLWVSECPTCHDKVERHQPGVRDRLCNTCKQWVPFVEVSYTGPEIGG